MAVKSIDFTRMMGIIYKTVWRSYKAETEKLVQELERGVP